MSGKVVIVVTLIALVGTAILAHADLNSGTKDADSLLNSIAGNEKATQSRETRASPSKSASKGEPKAAPGGLSVGIKKRADNCPRKAQKGDSLHIHYKGTLADGGREFDSSYERGKPLVFTLGIGQVIKGWDQGLLDICAGEKRKLVIPPHLAYGESGSPPSIPPHSTLVFEVEAVKVVPGGRKHEEL